MLSYRCNRLAQHVSKSLQPFRTAINDGNAAPLSCDRLVPRCPHCLPRLSRLQSRE